MRSDSLNCRVGLSTPSKKKPTIGNTPALTLPNGTLLRLSRTRWDETDSVASPIVHRYILHFYLEDGTVEMRELADIKGGRTWSIPQPNAINVPHIRQPPLFFMPVGCLPTTNSAYRQDSAVGRSGSTMSAIRRIFSARNRKPRSLCLCFQFDVRSTGVQSVLVCATTAITLAIPWPKLGLMSVFQSPPPNGFEQLSYLEADALKKPLLVSFAFQGTGHHLVPMTPPNALCACTPGISQGTTSSVASR